MVHVPLSVDRVTSTELSATAFHMSSLYVKSVLQATAAFILVSLITACGHDPVRQLPETDQRWPARSPPEQAAIVAVRQVGVPYRYGGSTVKGFDCSGLVQFAYARAGIVIPRTTAAQWRELVPVSGDKLRVGDLLFFRIKGRVSHVGLYLGSGRFIHAPSSGREVTIEELNSDYYRRAFVRGGRPIY